MASLVLKMSVSLDGYVAPIDGRTCWIAAGGSDDALSWAVETVSNVGAHLMGATTYAVMTAHWPGTSGPFAKPMNEIPKVVFSDSLASTGWGETTIAGDLAEAITRLKRERSDGYLLAHGGARFARSLVETGLIDEYRLLIHPAILGAGEPQARRHVLWVTRTPSQLPMRPFRRVTVWSPQFSAAHESKLRRRHHPDYCPQSTECRCPAAQHVKGLSVSFEVTCEPNEAANYCP